MELKSPSFENNSTVPKRHTCSGEDVSPPLAWTGAPQGTRSLALIMDDPDAPVGTWVHWVLYDLPAESKGLAEGLPKKETLPDGAKQGLCWGVEDFSRVGYHGPCPPPGKPHRYSFRLYALKEPLGLPPKATKAEVLKAMAGRVLGQAELVGAFKR
ncbi:MAG: YbhB/YbcL family Raf kinase inhibitor-like protein [Elusimicrobia bacterium]|nr:YbhB/YbcL family Raf kinase inhibitor-like protein [Elusimicrobiota bacterium]